MKPYFQSNDKRFTLYQGNCINILKNVKHPDIIFSDPPYFLSNNGTTCKSGKRGSVNKGVWDKSLGLKENYLFTKSWINECKKILSPNGTIWISGTFHNIYLIGTILQELNFKIMNNITLEKPNPPPNLSCRYFTHSTETILWAKQSKAKHIFNYKEMKKLNNNKQMKDVWRFSAPGKKEKLCGKHPTQKPLALLERIILASSRTNDLILDPFSGSATTGISAYKLDRRYIGIELDKEYLDLSIKRFKSEFE